MGLKTRCRGLQGCRGRPRGEGTRGGGKEYETGARSSKRQDGRSSSSSSSSSSNVPPSSPDAIEALMKKFDLLSVKLEATNEELQTLKEHTQDMQVVSTSIEKP
jgi:hypothetical protein